MRRRRFLVGAMCGGVAATLPGRAAAADTRRARRVLLIHLGGGARSSAAFIASRDKKYNPWGLISGAQLPLGRVLDPLDEANKDASRRRFRRPAEGQLAAPRLAALSKSFSLLGTWDPQRGDHFRSERTALTGSSDERGVGLLVRIYGGLEAARPKEDRLPSVAIGRTTSVSRAPPGAEAAVALELPNAAAVWNQTRGASSTGAGRNFRPEKPAIDLDENFVKRTAGKRRPLVARLMRLRRLRAELAAKLADPLLHFGNGQADSASLGEVQLEHSTTALTNRQLTTMLATGGLAQGYRNAPLVDNAALAIRFLQLGSPAVSLNVDGFDMHSGEDDRAREVYGNVGALWCGLFHVLSRVADPLGKGTMLDNTLVLTTSEFGRDPGQPATGFNGGGGSDHGSSPACYYVGHALMGAGVPGGRVFGGVDTSSYDARRQDVQLHPSRLLATICGAVGVDAEHPQWGFPGVKPIDLWGKKGA